MGEIAVVGSSAFIVGFQLAGVQKVFEVDAKKTAHVQLTAAQEDKEVAIIITDEQTIQGVDEQVREILENSVEPVCVVVSDGGDEQDSLRKLIIRSVGVDLLGDDHGEEN